MPHDCKGRPIDIGDAIKVRLRNGIFDRKVVGFVQYLYPSETCSGTVGYPLPGHMAQSSFNANESEIVLKHDGSEPAEVAKPGTGG